MRWQGERQSANVEDRRGVRGPVMIGGGLTTLVLMLVVWFLGGDPLALLQQIDQGQPPAARSGRLILPIPQRDWTACRTNKNSSSRSCSPTPRTSGASSSRD
jgi:predicted metalloprotease